MERVRGTQSGRQYVSTSNNVELRFASDATVTHPGFRASFRSKSRGIWLLFQLYLCYTPPEKLAVSCFEVTVMDFQ